MLLYYQVFPFHHVLVRGRRLVSKKCAWSCGVFARATSARYPAYRIAPFFVQTSPTRFFEFLTLFYYYYYFLMRDAVCEEVMRVMVQSHTEHHYPFLFYSLLFL
jgi:hypothetical protein